MTDQTKDEIRMVQEINKAHKYYNDTLFKK